MIPSDGFPAAKSSNQQTSATIVILIHRGVPEVIVREAHLPPLALAQRRLRRLSSEVAVRLMPTLLSLSSSREDGFTLIMILFARVLRCGLKTWSLRRFQDFNAD